MSSFEERYITVRREIIRQDLRRLNPMQREGAMTTEGPLLLLAGAGSGKTTVLIQRVYNLLTYGRGGDKSCTEIPVGADEAALAFLERFLDKVRSGAEPEEGEVRRVKRLCAVDPPKPWEILAITFTNKAAGELKERLAARLGPVANDVWASTFHSACVRILRRDIDRLGFDRDFTIYDTDDSRRVMKEVVKALDLDEKSFPPKTVLAEISRAKDQYIGPDAFAETAQSTKDWRTGRTAKLYDAYQKRLAAANALDFDDLIFQTVRLLQQEPEVRQHYQDKFRYVLVDEYQDTNHMQYLLTSLLAGGRKNLCVVGDDDQSIYKFRGANIENILHFEEQYAKDGVKVIRLEQNYRSTQRILDAANAVIGNNEGRKGKKLWTENQAGEPVRVRTVSDENGEADFIAGEALDRVKRGGSFRDVAVLYRMNAQSNALEYAMKRNGIPYRIVGGMKFFDRAEVRDMLAYLQVINTPLDDLRLRRIVNNPPRKIGAATLDRATALAAEQGASLYEIFRNADFFPELKTAKVKLLAFADLIDGLRKKEKTMDLADFYDEVCQATGYVRMLEERKDAESQGRLENVRELKSNIQGFLERSPEDPTLTGFLNEIALYTDLDGLEAGDDCVTMMTIHAAKGLEFPAVYVAGMEEGVFPGNSAQYSQEDMEEERRLCYVAMTRAKETLTLVRAHHRMLYGRTGINPPSRFLEEIPRDYVKEEGESGGGWLSGGYGGSYGGYGSYGGGYGGTGSYGGTGGYGGSGGSERRGGTWQTRGATRSAGTPPRRAAPQSVGGNGQSAAEKAPGRPEAAAQFAAGDRVEHTAFGPGTVREVKPMAGDVMAVVEFDNTGTKKLMLNYAGAKMKKLEEQEG